MSASLPSPSIGPNSPSRQTLEEVRFWMDNPELDIVSVGLNDAECRILRMDAEACRQLLVEAGRNPSRIVGAGSYGIVFCANDPRLNRTVAIKVLRPSVMVSKDARNRFCVEAKSLAQCETAGIVPLFEYGELSGIPFIVTQFIDGPNLSQELNKFVGIHSIPHACRLLIAICRTMQEMHNLAFIHRDLKPSNILLQRTDSTDQRSVQGLPYWPVVTDFGFAKELAAIADNKSSSTSIVGTVHYMAPEQALCESQKISVKSDVYSLGVILFELLTQRCPFAADSKNDLICKIARDEPPRPRDFAPHVSKDLEAIVLKCLEKEPDNRYPSAASLADDLQNYLDGRQTIARSVGPVRRVILAARRSKLLTALWCLVAILAALTSYGLWRERGLSRKLSVKNAAFEESVKQATTSYRKFYQRAAEQNWDTPGKMGERLELHKEALEFFRWKAKATNYDEQSRHDLSIALHYVSNSQSTVGQISSSAASRRECLELLEKLVKDFPDRDNYRFDLFMSLMLLGQVESTLAADSWSKALFEIDILCKKQPTNMAYLDAKNSLQVSVCHLLIRNDEFDRADKLAHEVLVVSKMLAEKCPENVNYGKYIPQCYAIIGRLSSKRSDYSTMVRSFDLAIDAQRKLSSLFEDKGPWLADEHHIRMQYIDALKSSKQFEKLVDQCLEQLEVLELMIHWYPEDKGNLMTRAQVELIASLAYRQLGASDRASDFLAKAKATRALVEADKDIDSASQRYERLLDEANQL